MTATNRPAAQRDARGPEMRQALCIALVCFALTHSVVAQQREPTSVPVGVVKAERKPIARTGNFVGCVESISRVEIRARTTGFLEEVLFKEGDLIKEGTPLYRIEKGLFVAQVEQAGGAPERSKAAKIVEQEPPTGEMQASALSVSHRRPITRNRNRPSFCCGLRDAAIVCNPHCSK